jgi:hypothetical protein
MLEIGRRLGRRTEACETVAFFVTRYHPVSKTSEAWLT